MLCGKREEVRAALVARFAGAPRVRVLGIIDRMPELLARRGRAGPIDGRPDGDGGARHGILGHLVRLGARSHPRNNAAFADHGMAQVAQNRDELRAAVHAALQRRAAPDLSFRALPTAAQVVVERFGAQAGAA